MKNWLFGLEGRFHFYFNSYFNYSMRHIVFLFLIFQANLIAQTVDGLVTWINMDNAVCEIKDEFGDPGVVIFPADILECTCGATGNGRYFDGTDDDFLILTGPSLDNILGSIDFTLSFYFKPDESNNTSGQPQVIFAKRDDCNQDTSFVIKYFPGGSRQISVEMIEKQNTSASFFATLPNTCWHHITVIRKSSETILYHNGMELKRASTISGTRVNINNDQAIIIGNSDCSADAGFKGVLDEIRLYERALKREEVEDLYLFPDNIANGLRFDDLKDTTIFLGGSVPIRLTYTCATQFSWTPASGVDSTHLSNPIITPSSTTTYMVEMEDSICSLVDSIRIVVVDPNDIECGDIFLPTAFTPNGDGLNDRFGISNPFSTGTILAFEIYDRWGNLVFSTTDVLDKWDGSFRGTPVNPGVFLYKLQYKCDQREELLTGSVTVVR